MLIALLKAKIHQAVVTAADLNYVGSIGIDSDLLAQSGIYPYEKVLVSDIDNGSRLETYVIPKPAGSREVSLNGAAARLVAPGDRIIIMAFMYVTPPPPAEFEPRILILDHNNEIVEMRGTLPDSGD